MKRKLWYHSWRLMIIAIMVAWTVLRFEHIGDTTKGLIKIGLDVVCTIFVTYKLYTSRFCYIPPSQYIRQKFEGKNKLLVCAPFIFFIIFTSIILCVIYKTPDGIVFNDTTGIVIGFICFMIIVWSVFDYFADCLIKK